MAANVSGAAFSSLLLEHSNANSDQEGFLLGKVVSHITDVISDSQLNNRKEETVTYISSHIPCCSLFSWYDNAGNLIHDRLKDLLKGKHKEVVGWYRYRKNTSMTMSMREKAVHKKLKEALPGISHKDFIFALFTSTVSGNHSTHMFDHQFITIEGRIMKRVPLTIVNLGDTNQSEYKLQPSNNVLSQADQFKSATNLFLPDFELKGGEMHQVVAMRSLGEHLRHQLMDLCESVVKSEEEIGSLNSEVQQLREMVAMKHRVKVSPPRPEKAVVPSHTQKAQEKTKKTLQSKPVPRPMEWEESGPSTKMVVSEKPLTDMQGDHIAAKVEVPIPKKSALDDLADIDFHPNPNKVNEHSGNNSQIPNHSNTDRLFQKSEVDLLLLDHEPHSLNVDPHPSLISKEPLKPTVVDENAAEEDIYSDSSINTEKQVIELRETSAPEKKDVFSFVDDMLTSVKTNSPVREHPRSSTLPRIGGSTSLSGSKSLPLTDSFGSLTDKTPHRTHASNKHVGSKSEKKHSSH